MLTVSELSLSFGDKKLFEDVNLQFLPGNCYGIIGANGAGKSTFLKILTGEQDADKGSVSKSGKLRMSVLKQDQHLYDSYSALETILMGHQQLYAVMKERDALYAKEDFSEADGIRAGELEELFTAVGGWEAETEAGVLISGLALSADTLEKNMGALEPSEKVRVLLAQALFGNPDILIMDEPTNGIDLESVRWLEDFLLKFTNIAIIVSHNRHFLNTVCTHIVDIDYSRMHMYVGNYDFWFEVSQLMQRQRKTEERKTEKMKEELKEFIQRFGSHKARARQATSRKKLLEKIDIEQLPQSTRKFPYIHFSPGRECGREVLTAKDVTVVRDGETVLKNFSLQVMQNQKIAFVGPYNVSKTALFEAIMAGAPSTRSSSDLSGLHKADSGTVEWGVTISPEYYPKDNSNFFKDSISIIDWLSSYTDSTDDQFKRGFLGRMLFSGDEAYKSVKVLSGGEKARCMLSKIMLASPNFIIFDEPTNHLDLETITTLNNALINFKGVLLFNSHDQQFIDTIADRIVEITPAGVIDKLMSFSEYVESDAVKKQRAELYKDSHARIEI